MYIRQFVRPQRATCGKNVMCEVGPWLSHSGARGFWWLRMAQIERFVYYHG